MPQYIENPVMPDSILGIPIQRTLEPWQSDYFSKNNQVAGMAIGNGLNGVDGERRIILNPSMTDANAKLSVARNEAIRHYMNDMPDAYFDYGLTPQQSEYFNKNYALAEQEAQQRDRYIKETILSRLLSGDPSAGGTKPMYMNEAPKAQQDKAYGILDMIRNAMLGAD